VFKDHQRFSPADVVPVVERECRAGPRVRGCFDCKMEVADRIAVHFAAARDKRAELEQRPERVDAVLADGNERARATAEETMRQVRAAMNLGGLGRGSS